MSIVRDLLKLTLFLFIFLFFFVGRIVAVKHVSFSSKVSAFIGEHHFTLFGYTSPNSRVNLEGQGIYDLTYSNKEGFFIFSNSFSPFSPRPFCLQSQDQLGRLNKAVCLPPFPVDYDIHIGPVILPPTLSLNKGFYFIGDDVVLSGQAIPNSKVTLSYFTEKKRKFLDVDAYSLPRLTLKTDSKGNYSIQLPSSSSLKYKVFTQAGFDRQYSPESVVLHLEILPWWMVFIRWVVALIVKHLLTLIFLFDLLVGGLFLYERKRKDKSIVLAGFYSHSIVKYE